MDRWRTATLGAVTVLALIGAAGCSRYYWNKPTGTPELFEKDSIACAQEGANFDERRYRFCMQIRGWIREKQFDPPPPGWFRGIE